MTADRRSVSGRALGLAALLTVAACSGGNEITVPETTSSATTTTVVDSGSDDGQLRLGVLLPANDALVGDPLLRAVDDAVRAVNDSGGVLGEQVDVVVADEGTTAASATEAVETLLDSSVDAVVGPASSLVALGVLADLVAAKIVTCSPTANALALDSFPDDDLFFRTIPSDRMVADVIADLAEQTGAATVAIAHIDDAYGRAFDEATVAAFLDQSIELVTSVPFSSRDDDLSEEATLIVDSGAEVIVVLGAGESPARFLSALDEFSVPNVARVIVNGAIRDPAAQPHLAALSSDLRERIVGVGAQAEADPGADPWSPDGAYATNAFDCVNLIALAALLAQSTTGSEIAGQIPRAASSGSSCTRFEECTEVLDQGRNFNYNGPSGVLEVNRSGEPVQARFIQFGFDDAGQDQWRDSTVFPR